MAVVVTVEEVRADFEVEVSNELLQMGIDLISQADVCLDHNNVPDAQQRALKLAGVRHFAFLQTNSGRGAVKSETAANGAGRSFAGYSGEGGSPYWGLLDQFDRFGCVTKLINTGPSLGLWTFGGGRSCRR